MLTEQVLLPTKLFSQPLEAEQRLSNERDMAGLVTYSVIQVPGKWEENDHEFETSLGTELEPKLMICEWITMKPFDQQLSWTGGGGVYTVAWTLRLHFLP